MIFLIDISNAPGASVIKRKVEIRSHTKDYYNETYVVPYKIKHYDNNNDAIMCIPDYISVLNANNGKRVWIGPQGQYSEVFVAGYTEMGQYDFLQNLQKTLTDQQIITAQIQKLDTEGKFNIYLIGNEEEENINNFG